MATFACQHLPQEMSRRGFEQLSVLRKFFVTDGLRLPKLEGFWFKNVPFNDYARYHAVLGCLPKTLKTIILPSDHMFDVTPLLEDQKAITILGCLSTHLTEIKFIETLYDTQELLLLRHIVGQVSPFPTIRRFKNLRKLHIVTPLVNANLVNGMAK